MGWMTGTLLGTAIVANIAMGWIGDRWERKWVMEIGLGAAALGALLAWWAPSAAWFYLVFALTAVGNVAIWTIGITMSMDFGTEAERPTYIGMSNTLIAPANILAPFLGGWLAQIGGYPAAFLASAAGGLLAIAVFHWRVK
jgi:MFS family permease